MSKYNICHMVGALKKFPEPSSMLTRADLPQSRRTDMRQQDWLKAEEMEEREQRVLGGGDISQGRKESRREQAVPTVQTRARRAWAWIAPVTEGSGVCYQVQKTCDVSCSYLHGRQHDAALATSREEEMAWVQNGHLNPGYVFRDP